MNSRIRNATPEELLILAVLGDSQTKRAVARELDRRALGVLPDRLAA